MVLLVEDVCEVVGGESKYSCGEVLGLETVVRSGGRLKKHNGGRTLALDPKVLLKIQFTDLCFSKFRYPRKPIWFQYLDLTWSLKLEKLARS